MKKIIVLSIVGLLIGMAGAVGIVLAREKEARASAAYLAADSAAAHADSVQADSLVGAGTLPDSLVADSVSLLEGDSAGTATGAGSDSANVDVAVDVTERPGGQPDSATRVVLAASSPANPDQQRLARIFAAMRPDQAARVLEQMTDPEVRLLLGQLRERQAAAIMASISPERAAVISSAVIRSGRSTP